MFLKQEKLMPNTTISAILLIIV